MDKHIYLYTYIYIYIYAYIHIYIGICIDMFNKIKWIKKKKKRSAGTGFVSVSAFASLLGILIGITSSAATIKNCVIA